MSFQGALLSAAGTTWPSGVHCCLLWVRWQELELPGFPAFFPCFLLSSLCVEVTATDATA